MDPIIRNKILALLKSKLFKITAVIGFILIAQASFAEDPLAGTEPVVKDAYNGSIKTYLYIGEAIAAFIIVIFTRNIKTLGLIGALAIFLNIVAILAGF